MRILALTSSYPKFAGDSTAPFIEAITTHVAAFGHEVHVVLPEHRDWAWPAVDDGVHYHTYRYSPSRSWTPWGFSESLEGGIAIKPPLYALAPIVSLSALRAAGRVLGRSRFDLVHAHWVIPNGPVGAAVARRHRLPLVVSLHGSDVSVSERHRSIGRAARWSFERASAVTAPSEDLLERSRKLGAHAHPEVIPYGADVGALQVDEADTRDLRARLGFDDEAIVVLAIGRFVHWKGFEYLIDAVATASAEHPALRLVLVGDGDLRQELEARARASGIAGGVTFAGMVGRDAIAAYLGVADVVTVPSIHYGGYVDGLPNVALEAMAAGKALVATRVGGLPQLVRDGVNGLLVEEQDVADLAAAILALGRDPGLRARLGATAQAEIRDERSWDAVARRFVDVYERAATGR